MSKKRKGRRKSTSPPVRAASRAPGAPVPPATAARRPRWLPWVLVGAGVVLLLALSAVGPERLSGLFSRSEPTAASLTAQSGAPVQLTILHTNDTWGFVLPCG